MIRLQKNILPEKIVPALFAAGSVIFFSVLYNDHLYQREQLQMFLFTPRYLVKSLSVNGGLAGYAGEFLTQFFRVPVAGSVIITVLLLLLYVSVKKLSESFTGKKRFNLFYLPAPVGYCLLLTDQFYYLSGLIGLIISVAASAYYIKRRLRGAGFITGMILLPVVYWVAGGAFLVLFLNMMITEIMVFLKDRQKRSLKTASFYISSFAAMTLIVPLAARKFLLTDTLLQSYVSEAYYAVRIFFPFPLILVFLSIPFTLILQASVPGDLPARRIRYINIGAIIVLTVAVFWGFSGYPDYSGEKRMAYENMVYDSKWDRIVTTAEADPPFDQVSMTALNLALAMTGRLSSEMFMFDQNTGSLFIPYQRKGQTSFMSDEPYYYLGLVNFSQMFAVETIESTVDGRLPVRAVRRAAETYMLNSQYDIARKYLNMVSHTLFYRSWALQKLRLIDSGKDFTGDPELALIKKRMPQFDFFYDYGKMDAALSYLLLSNRDNRLAFEYLMADCLLKKDLDGFLQNIARMKELNYNETPRAYQEAIAYVLTRLDEKPSDLVSMVTDKAVIENLQAYAGAYSANRTDTSGMKLKFGKTYWYYLHYK